MRIQTPQVILLTVLCGAAALHLAQGGGPLDPSTAPRDGVYKTLQEVEPRTCVATLPFVISESGSYCLTRNLHFTDPSGAAITVDASDVTIDLNGFTLSSDPGVTGRAIDLTANSPRIVIRNGFIRGSTVVAFPGSEDPDVPGGFKDGVGTASIFNTEIDCRVENLTVSGCRQFGLLLGGGSRIENCTVAQSGNFGIVCVEGTVRGSSSNRNAGHGIVAASVIDCEASFNGANGIGFDDDFSEASIVSECRVFGNGGSGIRAELITNCVARNNGVGLSSPFSADGVITGSYAAGNDTDIVTTGTRTGNFPAP